MMYWLLVGNSCPGCDTQGATLMAKEPGPEDILKFMRSLGGMLCIRVKTYTVDTDSIGPCEPCKVGPV